MRHPLPSPHLAAGLLSACLVLVSALVSSGASARCARANYLPQLITPNDRPLPANATFLVALTRRFGGQYRHLDGQLPENAELVSGETHIALRRVMLGAGLARLEPATRPTLGTWTLTGLGDPIQIAIASRGALRVAAAQVPRRVELRIGRMRVRSRRGGTSSTRGVRATLPSRGRSPAALIVYYDGEPGAASVVPEGVRDLVVFQQNIPCASPLAGTRMPRPGERIELAAVDYFGRVSRRVAK